MNAPCKIQIADIVEACAAHYAVTPVAIRSSRRNHEVMEARHVACWFASALTEKSSVQIGKALGNRDPTTVIFASRKIEARRLDPAFRETMDGIEAAIRAAARLREMNAATPALAVDPREVARRILEGGERAASQASMAEIMALAEALAIEEDEEEAADRQSAVGNDLVELAEDRSPPALGELVAEMIEADAALRRNSMSARAFTRLALALDALRAFQTEPAIAGFFEAHKALEAALYTRGERGARVVYERALNALSQQFLETVHG